MIWDGFVPMDAAFVNMILSQTGMGGIAALAMWLMNKSHQDALRREIANNELMRAERAELIRVMNDTTKALTALESAIYTLTHDRDNNTRRATQQN